MKNSIVSLSIIVYIISIIGTIICFYHNNKRYYEDKLTIGIFLHSVNWLILVAFIPIFNTLVSVLYYIFTIYDKIKDIKI